MHAGGKVFKWSIVFCQQSWGQTVCHRNPRLAPVRIIQLEKALAPVKKKTFYLTSLGAYFNKKHLTFSRIFFSFQLYLAEDPERWGGFDWFLFIPLFIFLRAAPLQTPTCIENINLRPKSKQTSPHLRARPPFNTSSANIKGREKEREKIVGIKP